MSALYRARRKTGLVPVSKIILSTAYEEISSRSSNSSWVYIQTCVPEHGRKKGRTRRPSSEKSEHCRKFQYVI